MKEIKFRVWNGSKMEHNIMAGFLGTFYVQGIDEKDSASMSPFNTKYPDPVRVMQFTGLKDKNGDDIWEGDILKHENGYLKEVKWGHHLWAFITINRKPTMVYQTAAFPNQFEIIGNIYETPELINHE
jgi:hypothetical protein